MKRLQSLWQGQVPLGEAFWTWTIGVGLAVNLFTSILFLALISADRPWLALLAGYVPSVPFNILAVVGVWRAAGRYPGPDLHADLARSVVIFWMVLLTVT